MRARVMLGDNINMVNVQEAMKTLLDDIDGSGFKFHRTVPGKPFIVEVDAKTKDDINRIYDRAIDRW